MRAMYALAEYDSPGSNMVACEVYYPTNKNLLAQGWTFGLPVEQGADGLGAGHAGGGLDLGVAGESGLGQDSRVERQQQRRQGEKDVGGIKVHMDASMV